MVLTGAFSLVAWHLGGSATAVSFCRDWTENGGTTRRAHPEEYAPNLPLYGTFQVQDVGMARAWKGGSEEKWPRKGYVCPKGFRRQLQKEGLIA